MKIEVITIPKEGEIKNGDAYFVRETNGCTVLAVIDGIGHGDLAHAASQKVVECLEACCNPDTDQDLDFTIRSCHEALQSTRGAVLAIAHIVDDCIRFVGIGNITALKVRDRESHFTSMNGIVGRNLKNVKVFSYPYNEGDTILMYSDGIRGLDTVRYDLSRDLHELGEVILRDHRVDDDSTILLAR
ncbi:MAG: SpoIIE family protein phosphatase [Euryarchaeota archaeon]|nr:SpoIIE family protein phosphatase [Euryarchaeota archaeon]